MNLPQLKPCSSIGYEPGQYLINQSIDVANKLANMRDLDQ